MKKYLLPLVFAVLLPAIMPAPAQASWAIAIAKGGDPIVNGNDNTSIDQGPATLAMCNLHAVTKNCKLIAQGNHSCVALANNGAPGTHIRWTAGQGNMQTVAYAAALNSCTALHAGACKVVHAFCR